MSNQSKECTSEMFASLPPEVLYVVFSFCDFQTLGRLSCVCKRLNALISSSYLWIQRSKNILATNQRDRRVLERSRHVLDPIVKCWQSIRWQTGRYEETVMLRHFKRFIPWLQLERETVWYSQGASILKFGRRPDGGIQERHIPALCGHSDDVCRFVVKGGLCISGGSDGSFAIWKATRRSKMHHRRHCHAKAINSVDFNGNIVVTGSQDRSIKIWSLDENFASTLACTIHLWDRVCSVAIMKGKQLLLSGSAGCRGVPPLQAFDLKTGALVTVVGGPEHRNGAGVLHVYPETQNQLLSCGYDTYVRLWDLRSPATCVRAWEDPHDSCVYCVASDHNVTVLSGTNRYGLVRLWDKRMMQQVKMYYVGMGNSPVYSLAFDPSYMYVALDQTLNMLSFTGRTWVPSAFE